MMPIQHKSVTELRGERPSVSVFVLCYNQEAYIKQTIESILNQQTEFHFEIILSDDASTDGTSEICKTLTSNHYNIKYIRREKNLGLMANFVETAKELKGDYVAICDGDDYWNDSNKLQMQVEFLESNIDYAVVGTQAAVLLQNGQSIIKSNPVFQEYTFEEMALENRIIAPTAMFRSISDLLSLPQWFETLPYGDWPIYLMVLNTYNAKACVLPKETAVYRSDVGESFKMRKNLSEIFYNNARIVRLLQKEPNMKNVKFHLTKSFLSNKKREMSSRNVKGEYLKGIQIFLKLMFIKPSITLLKSYLFSIKKNILSQ